MKFSFIYLIALFNAISIPCFAFLIEDKEPWSCDIDKVPFSLTLDDLEKFGKAHLEILNADRLFFQIESDGALPLHWDKSLWKAALCHAKAMCDNEFFSHVDPQGSYPWDRMDKTVNIPLESYAENIAYAWQSLESSESLPNAANRNISTHHRGYMDECQCNGGCSSGKQAGHRSNNINPDFTRVGIAEWPCEKNGRFYNVMDFGRYKGEAPKENKYCKGGITLDPPHPFSTIDR